MSRRRIDDGYVAVLLGLMALAGACASSADVGMAATGTPLLDAGPIVVDGAFVPRGDAISASTADAHLSSSDVAAPPDVCVNLIYLIGQDSGAAPDVSGPVVLYSFDPATLTLTRIGPIPCMSASDEFAAASCAPPTGAGCSAGMTVDDKGTAWIFTPMTTSSSSSQTLFAVSTKDASCIGAPVSVSSPGYGVAAASFVSHGDSELSAPGLWVSLQPVVAPSGVLTVGTIDTSSGVVSGVQAVASAAGPLTEPSWYATGGMATSPAQWLMLQDWPLNGSPSVLYVASSCQGAEEGCANTEPGGGSAPDGSPVLVSASNMGAFPSELTFASQPWAAIWAPYFVATTTNGMYFNDIYYFAPGWWSGSRAVTQVNINDGYSVAEAMPDLGADVFAAAAGPSCPPVAVPPPPPPLK